MLCFSFLFFSLSHSLTLTLTLSHTHVGREEKRKEKKDKKEEKKAHTPGRQGNADSQSGTRVSQVVSILEISGGTCALASSSLVQSVSRHVHTIGIAVQAVHVYGGATAATQSRQNFLHFF
jgi:hypothetical protein